MSLRPVSGVEQLSQAGDDWRNREHVVLDLFSNLKMGKILWYFWLTSRASDNSTWTNLSKQKIGDEA